MARASIIGQPVHMTSPLVPALLLLVSLARVNLADHHKKVIWRAVVCSLVMLATAVGARGHPGRLTTRDRWKRRAWRAGMRPSRSCWPSCAARPVRRRPRVHRAAGDGARTPGQRLRRHRPLGGARRWRTAGLARNVEVFNLPGASGAVGLQRLVNERGNGGAAHADGARASSAPSTRARRR